MRKILKGSIFATFDKIPRFHASISASRFYNPKVKSVTMKDEAALNTRLSWLSKDKTLVANLKLPKARAPVLPSALQNRQSDRVMAKAMAESTRLISTVRCHLLPIIKDSSLLIDLLAILSSSQELCDTCWTDGIPL